jgi:hypothetical protein
MNPALLIAALLLSQRNQTQQGQQPAQPAQPPKPATANKALLGNVATALAPAAMRLPIAIIAARKVETDIANEEKEVANEVRLVAAELRRSRDATPDFLTRSAPRLSAILLRNPQPAPPGPVLLPPVAEPAASPAPPNPPTPPANPRP